MNHFNWILWFPSAGTQIRLDTHCIGWFFVEPASSCSAKTFEEGGWSFNTHKLWVSHNPSVYLYIFVWRGREVMANPRVRGEHHHQLMAQREGNSLSHHFCSNFAPILLHYFSIVAPFLHLFLHFCSTISPFLLHFCTYFAPVFLQFCTYFAPLFLKFCSIFAPFCINSPSHGTKGTIFALPSAQQRLIFVTLL